MISFALVPTLPPSYQFPTQMYQGWSMYFYQTTSYSFPWQVLALYTTPGLHVNTRTSTAQKERIEQEVDIRGLAGMLNLETGAELGDIPELRVALLEGHKFPQQAARPLPIVRSQQHISIMALAIPRGLSIQHSTIIYNHQEPLSVSMPLAELRPYTLVEMVGTCLHCRLLTRPPKNNTSHDFFSMCTPLESRFLGQRPQGMCRRGMGKLGVGSLVRGKGI